ncbi:hypothetical protein [Portibacter lacus]|uniref:DUF4340 domain-containing protein n=1 Tax=Portibacter lacus TaxID=1099794 RepID=A0AA37SYJ9_9BACT|nr:hypothetical protein [Portibacter lacus]GLR20058.1 hypothetical protein GCM10007940_46740 [Portibacter lacus]
MGNKRTLLLLGLLVVLCGFGYYMYKNTSNTSSTIDTRDRKFAVEEEEDIAKILIAQRNGKQVILEKKDGKWFDKDGELIHPNVMGNLLDVLTGIELKYIPPRSAYDNMMKAVGRIGIKVEIYDKTGKLLKGYQVGGTTAGELGTVFLMDGYTQPYVLSLPNFEGSLRGRFLINDIDQIKDRTVFSYTASDIKEINILYPKDRKQSFKLLRNPSGEYDLQPYAKGGYKISGDIKPGAIENFIRSFQDVDAEAFENDHVLKDSIQALMPLVEISVTDIKDVTKSVKLYPFIDIFNPEINTRIVDEDKRIERYFADCSWGEFMIVQDLLFSKVLWRYEEFY